MINRREVLKYLGLSALSFSALSTHANRLEIEPLLSSEDPKFWQSAQGDIFGVRHSTHIFNSVEEIDTAIRLVNEWAG